MIARVPYLPISLNSTNLVLHNGAKTYLKLHPDSYYNTSHRVFMRFHYFQFLKTKYLIFDNSMKNKIFFFCETKSNSV